MKRSLARTLACINIMKDYLILLLLVLFYNSSWSQNFAPNGATWYYNEVYWSSGDTGYIKIESKGDTLVRNKISRILRCDYSCWPGGTLATFQSNDSVYLYHPDLDTFQLIYVFQANKNDSWMFLSGSSLVEVDTTIVTVDSVYFKSVNGLSLRTLAVTYEVLNYYSPNSHLSYESEIVVCH